MIFRLSSLGDVILATAALSVANYEPASTDWVVSKEYAGLLCGHPAIRKVWTFDRREGLGAWVKLCRELAASAEYDEVLDLHASLRTRLARALFLLFGKGTSPRWQTISKSRWRRWGYCAFKSLWPRAARPVGTVIKSAKLAGGSGTERPDLRHLFTVPLSPVLPVEFKPGSYLCVMPAARWSGKCWPVGKYVALLSRLGLPAVVLGTEHDAESVSLARTLAQVPQIQSHSLLGQRSFTDLAQILAGSLGYLGNDTGLGHLAEAVGVPALMVFGPTASDFGFGPWRKESRSVGSSLWCRPCGKDGRACFRQGNKRYLCLKSLDPAQVESLAREIWPSAKAALR